MAKYTSIQYFFWLVAGSEIHVLKNCRNDYNRHATMGFILFMTWLFASFAGGLAGWFFSGSVAVAIIVGIIWGCMIYAIDRGMVTSLKKDPNQVTQPFALPFFTRFILGLLIALFISIPIEIAIFHEEIAIQLPKDKLNEVLEQMNKQDSANRTEVKQLSLKGDQTEAESLSKLLKQDCPDPQYKSLMSQYQQVRQEADTKQANARSAYNHYVELISDNPYDSVSKHRIHYPEDIAAKRNSESLYGEYSVKSTEAKKILDSADAISNKYFVVLNARNNNLQSKIVEQKAELEAIGKVVDSTKKETEKQVGGLNGFTRQYVALGNAAKNDNSLWWLRLLVKFAFIIIEILPTLYKLKTPIGDYDRAIYANEEIFSIEADTNIKSKREQEVLRLEKDKLIAQAAEDKRETEEKLLNEKLLLEVAKVQEEVVLKHLKDWKEKETGII